MAPRVEARFLIPGVGHPDRPLVDVLLGVVAREVQAALTRDGISGRVNANTQVVHTTRFGVPASMNVEVTLTSEDDLARAEGVLLATLARLSRTPPDNAVVDLAKKRLRADWYRLSVVPDRLAFEIGHFQVMDTWRTLQPYLEARERATPTDVSRLAATYFVAENRTIGVVRPPEVDANTPASGPEAR